MFGFGKKNKTVKVNGHRYLVVNQSGSTFTLKHLLTGALFTSNGKPTKHSVKKHRSTKRDTGYFARNNDNLT